MNDDVERLRKQLVNLESRADNLEKRYDRLIGKADEFIPKTTAIMREGIPLEIFTRLKLIEIGFQVFGIYPYDYISRESDTVERSVDIYAARDTIFTADGGAPRPERNHLLVEIKQRKPGVEWIFSTLPKTRKEWNMAGEDIPVVSSGFEIRPSESGHSSSGNPKDVVNAIAQLNEAYVPFMQGLRLHHSLEYPGFSWRYASGSGHDYVWLLLITNSKLKYFVPPAKFQDIGTSAEQESALFREVPWIVYQPERSLSLRYHQEQTVQRSGARERFKPDSMDRHLMDAEVDWTHQVHVVHYEHLAQFIALVDDPPRLKAIQLRLSVDGAPATEFTIKPPEAD